MTPKERTTMYEVGNTGEIIENLEGIAETFKQVPRNSYCPNCGADMRGMKQAPTEWQHDHEILKAYSDGVNEVIDKIISEIEKIPSELTKDGRRMVRRVSVVQILDKYKSESEEK